MERLLGNGRVICGLPAQPPTVAQTKVATKPKVRVGCDGALTRNDLADPLCWHADVLSEAVPCKTQWLEKLFFKHLAGGNRLNSAHGFRFICRANLLSHLLQVFRFKPSVFGHPRQHSRPDFFTIVESEGDVCPTGACQCSVRASLTLDRPTLFQQCCENQFGLFGRPLTHAAAGRAM